MQQRRLKFALCDFKCDSKPSEAAIVVADYIREHLDPEYYYIMRLYRTAISIAKYYSRYQPYRQPDYICNAYIYDDGISFNKLQSVTQPLNLILFKDPDCMHHIMRKVSRALNFRSDCTDRDSKRYYEDPSTSLWISHSS